MQARGQRRDFIQRGESHMIAEKLTLKMFKTNFTDCPIVFRIEECFFFIFNI
jgi:hypothetical protein